MVEVKVAAWLMLSVSTNQIIVSSFKLQVLTSLFLHKLTPRKRSAVDHVPNQHTRYKEPNFTVLYIFETGTIEVLYRPP